MTGASEPVQRRKVTVDGVALSYLHAGSGPPVLLVHGTFWSRVWEPVMADIAGAGYEVYALDFPGFGRSGGRLNRTDASVPSLARCAWRFLDTVGVTGPVTVAGHDIGGAVAQHLAAFQASVGQLVLMNSVLYDSWPVPAVERFRDPAVADAITVDELLQARAQSLTRAVARPLDDAEREAWLAPWHTEDRVRSWTAMAGAADARYTLKLLDRLRDRALPTLLLWGEDDEFQPIAYAERYAREMQGARLVRIPNARHIPTVEDPRAVGADLVSFLTHSPSGSDDPRR
jgi:pimeloyl-ACP methyl ester carboxylesterase